MTIPAKAPPQPSVVASGMYRLGAVVPPESELRLLPISEDFRKPVIRSSAADDEDDDGGGYQVAALSSAQVVAPRQQVSRAKRAYRRQVRSGLDTLLKLSDLAYLWCLPFILLILFGAATDQRNLAILGALAVILLSLGRLAIDGFFLVAVHFKNNLRDGILFFIPPLTFYYLAKRWKTMKRAATRLLTPLALIAGVALAFVFIPSLSSGRTPTNASVRQRVKGETGILRKELKGQLDRGADVFEKAAAKAGTAVEKRRSDDATVP